MTDESSSKKTKKKSGSEKRKRNPLMGFRVDENERAEILAAASRAGLEPSSYMRTSCLATPKTRARRRPPIEKEMMAQLLGQLGKAGGNIHQLVKYQNIHKEGVDRDSYLRAMTLFEKATAAILEALGREVPE